LLNYFLCLCGLKANKLQVWLFCLKRQNRYCFSNTKYRYQISAVKIGKHWYPYRPKKNLSVELYSALL